jgi:membrane protease YdiL (CAAX protease family)
MNFTGRRSPGLLEGLAIWVGMYLCANIAVTITMVLTGRGNVDQTKIPIWATAVAVTAMWSVFLFAVPRFLPYEDLSENRSFSDWISVRDVAIGVPLGFASQYILMNVVNWPLMKLFPDSFSFDEISQRATDLTNTAPGGWVVVLVLVVVVGAPIVEEIVYRGAVQTHLQRTAGTAVALIGTAVLFAAIHMSLIEFPGLFAFALVLGYARLRSDTLGLPIVTHMAFNAAGLILVLVK